MPMVKHADGLNLMSASSGGSILGTFNNGSTIFLVNETLQNETMFYVYCTMSNGTTTYGWCSGEYLAKESEYAYLKSTDNWYIRKNADRYSDDLGLLISGSFIRLLEKSCATANGYTWHKVLYNNNVGY